VIATHAHRAAFARRLTTLGMDVPACVRRGQYVDLDADGCLAAFMVDGAPDRARFFAAVTPHLEHARHAGYERIRLFGEMVALLRQLCEGYRPLASAMPAAQAVLLSLDDLSPDLGGAVRAVAAGHSTGAAR